MKTITGAQSELIQAVLAERDVGELTAGILEKDIHVTDALGALFTAELPGVRLIFCGGTSLSKGYDLIKRMSEDVDLKIELAPYAGQSKTKDSARFKDIANTIATLLSGLGFEEVAEQRKVVDGYRQMEMGWRFERQFEWTHAIRPELKVEFKAGTPSLPTALLSLGYLVDTLAGTPQPRFEAHCLAYAETLSDKTMAFLRRYAQSQQGAPVWDETLLRHVHDVHCILSQYPDAASEAAAIFGPLLQAESQRYRGQFPAFADDPKQTLQASLVAIEQDQHLKTQYNQKLISLLYGRDRPHYEQALASFKSAAQQLLQSI